MSDVELPKRDSHAYITTQSCLRVAIPGFEVMDVRVVDIVHSLAMQCRYLGHCREFYSVAEHSVKVCVMAEREHGVGSEIARCALLHDGAEAYTGDFPSPFKKAIPELKEFEQKLEAVVHEALRLPPPEDEIWAEVKRFDTMALYQEASFLFTPAPPWVQEIPPEFEHPIHCLMPHEAKLLMTCKLREYGYHV